MELFAWIFFLTLIASMYGKMFIRIYKRWKHRKQISQTPLLGVVYPQTKKDPKDK